MPGERLETERLILRPPQTSDVPHLVALLGDYDVAKNLASAPHPYTEEHGHAFVARAANKRAEGADYVFAIVRRADGAYVGTCGVHPDRDWEIGYWIGKPYWGRGYVTEATRRLAAFAFDELGTDHLSSGWFQDNPASARVLTKIGFVAAGAEERDSVARGCTVVCNRVTLTRAHWRTLEPAL